MKYLLDIPDRYTHIYLANERGDRALVKPFKPYTEPEQRWIPTSKERPPQHQEIWITDDLGIVKLVYGKVGVWWLDENYYIEDEIIAWMPANVPEPYQPKEESE